MQIEKIRNFGSERMTKGNYLLIQSISITECYLVYQNPNALFVNKSYNYISEENRYDC
jgi:hypothetical protein